MLGWHDTGGCHWKDRHPGKCPPMIWQNLPVSGRGIHFAGEMLRFDGDVTIFFHEATPTLWQSRHFGSSTGHCRQRVRGNLVGYLCHLWHHIRLRLLPAAISDVSLVHHIIPFSSREVVIVGGGQLYIFFEQLSRSPGELVCAAIAMRSVVAVLRHSDVQFVYDGACPGGIQDQLKKCVAHFVRELRVYRLCLVGDRPPLLHHTIRLPVML